MELYRSLAKLYDLLYAYRDYGFETEFLLPEIVGKRQPSILDVCCGTGSHLQALSRKLPLASLAGVDLNAEMVSIAREKVATADLQVGDMRTFDLQRKFDLVYCFSSSIQYNLTEKDLAETISNLRSHSTDGRVVFDLAFCAERWREGYTNVTANADEHYQVAELFTSHSKEGISHWNPVYLIKDNTTGKLDMKVDKQRIRVWKLEEVRRVLDELGTNYSLERGFDRKGGEKDIPIFVLGRV